MLNEEQKELKTISQLVKNVLKANNKLNSSLSELSKSASELFGSELVADICNGDEIEFRKEGDDLHQEITIEELVELEKIFGR